MKKLIRRKSAQFPLWRHAEDEEGRGADVSFKECTKSFDGLAACGVNDTLFVNSHVGNKGGAVAIIEDDSASSYIELHRCTVENATAGTGLEEDPHGEGGGFSVGRGATLVLANCILRNNTSGRKVGLDFGCLFDVLSLPSTGGSSVRCCVPYSLLRKPITGDLLTQEEPLQSDVVPVQAPQVPVRIHLRLNHFRDHYRFEFSSHNISNLFCAFLHSVTRRFLARWKGEANRCAATGAQ